MSEEQAEQSGENQNEQPTKTAAELKTEAQTAFVEGDLPLARKAALEWKEASGSREAELFLKRLEPRGPKNEGESKRRRPIWIWAILAIALIIGGAFGAMQFLTPPPVEPPAVIKEQEVAAKPEIQLEPTDDPAAEPTPEPTKEPPPLPEIEPTAEPVLNPTASPTPEPTARPTKDPAVLFSEENLPKEGGELLFGPITAVIKHDITNNALDPSSRDFAISESYVITNAVENFVLTTELITPYSSAENNWDAGIEFRDTNPRNANPTNTDTGFYQMRISASNSGVYQFRYRSYLNNSWAYLDSGVIQSGLLNQEKNSTNKIKLIVNGRQWELYLNDTFVAESTQEMRRIREPGQVRVAIGMEPGSERKGAKTKFENTAIWSISKSR